MTGKSRAGEETFEYLQKGSFCRVLAGNRRFCQILPEKGWGGKRVKIGSRPEEAAELLAINARNGCFANILMLMGSREGSKVLYRNIVSEVFDCHRSFAIVPGINAEKIAEHYMER